MSRGTSKEMTSNGNKGLPPLAVRRLTEYVEREYLPYKVDFQGKYIYINSGKHPFEKEFLDKLSELGLKIISITHLKEIGLSITCMESLD